jgi:hypothetical protein
MIPLHGHVSTRTASRRRAESYHMIDLQERVADKKSRRRGELRSAELFLGAVMMSADAAREGYFYRRVAARFVARTRVGELVWLDS